MGGRQEVEDRRRLELKPVHLKTLPGSPDGIVDYSDTKQAGLRLRVSPSGRRTFLAAYRLKGKSRKVAIGEIGSKVLVPDGKGGEETVVLTLTVARDMVADIKARVRAGHDPAEERRAARREVVAGELIFGAYLDAFLVEELPQLRPATQKDWRRYIEAEIRPALGNVAPEAVTSREVARLRARIGKRAPVAAERCYGVLRRVLDWSSVEDEGVDEARDRRGLVRLPSNPAAMARGYRRRRGRNKKTRALAATKAFTDDQLAGIFAAAEKRSGAFYRLLRFVALTCVRAHDARAARWEDVDAKRRVWTIPTHKVSDFSGAPHVVPLTDHALAVLTESRETNLAAGFGASPWVFPAWRRHPCEVCALPVITEDEPRQIGHLDKSAKVPLSIMRELGIAGRGLLHRMRDSFKTRASERGIAGNVSEAVLGHLPGGIVGVYDHSTLLPQRREALEWWAEEVGAIVGSVGEVRDESR